MLDIRGRSIRTGKFSTEQGVEYKEGDKVEIRTDGIEIESN